MDDQNELARLRKEVSELRQRLELGDTTKVIAGCSNILQSRPAYSSVWQCFGSALERQGDAVRAQKCFIEASIQNPHSPINLVNLGVSFRENGNTALALLFFNAAHALQPNDLSIALRYAEALSDVGENHTALAVARKFSAEKPHSLLGYKTAKYASLAGDVALARNLLSGIFDAKLDNVSSIQLAVEIGGFDHLFDRFCSFVSSAVRQKNLALMIGF